MASAFIGLTVQVKLQKGDMIQGLVTNVVDQNLCLKNVLFFSTGTFQNDLVVNGRDIADLEVVPTPHPQPPRASQPQSQAQAQAQAQAPPQATTQHSQTQTMSRNNSQAPFKPIGPPSRTSSFPKPLLSLTPSSVTPIADPAILSYTKTAIPKGPAQTSTTAPRVNNASKPALALHPQDINVSRDTLVSPAQVSATLTAPFAGLANEPSELHSSSSVLQAGHKTGGPAVLQKPLPAATNGSTYSPPSSPEMTRRLPTSRKARKTQKPSSSVQEPLVEAETAKSQVKKARTARRRGRADHGNNSGWATEDATDIQELGDFDFEGSLSQFDKRSVFDQLRIEDKTADEDRLVSFNRVKPLPGTAGGKNLHFTENVLDLTPKLAHTSSQSSGEDDGILEKERLPRASARSIRRDLSRISINAPLRKNNSNLTSTSPIDNIGSILRNHSRPNHPASQLSSTSLERRQKARFRFQSSNRTCPVASPLNLAEAYDIAELEYLITEDLIAEHAARSIADIALAAINPGGRRLATINHNTSPVIVILASNTKWGSRAVAAARLLVARGARVIVSCLGFSPPSPESHLPANLPISPSEAFDTQVARLTAAGAYIADWSTTSSYLKTLDAPPELIIDALLGAHHDIHSILPLDTEPALHAMMAWANASKASVLAVDIPSGIDGTTGAVKVWHGEPAEVRARVVVCLAAPCQGLLCATQAKALEAEPPWKILVCDAGINHAWKSLAKQKQPGQGHGRNFAALIKGIKFGGEVMAELTFEADG